MSLSFLAIAEAPLATASDAPSTSDKKVPPRRQLTAVADTQAEPDAR
jgi:hypothetical protein